MLLVLPFFRVRGLLLALPRLVATPRGIGPPRPLVPQFGGAFVLPLPFPVRARRSVALRASLHLVELPLAVVPRLPVGVFRPMDERRRF